MIRILLLSVFALWTASSFSQELNFNVQVKAPRLLNADPKVFQTLEKDVREFLNNTKWTEDEYEDFEKIEGNLNITITEDASTTSFTADIFVQSLRPVYNSSHKTQIMNLVDNGVSFTYNEAQPIEDNAQSYVDPLSSVLTYYVFMILAYDYDSFSPFGGDPYYNIAQNVVSAIPTTNSAVARGWQALGNRRNRYWKVENMLNPKVRPMRQAIYEYHLISLDKMHEDVDKSKAVMVSALNTIQQVNNIYPNSAAVQMFADSKRNEIIEIFKGSSKGQQKKVYDIMVKIDPAQASQYNPLR